MFGEYIDLDNDMDICGMNRGGGFDDPSDETNYSFDAQSDTSASISDDYIDTFDSENEEKEPVKPQMVEEEAPTAEALAEEKPATEEYEPQKNSSSIYVLGLVLVLLAAAGLFYYKKNIAPSSVPTNNQEMGDYFYDKAVENGAEPTEAVPAVETPAAENTAETFATVDVDLTPTEPAVPSVTKAPEPQTAEKAPKLAAKTEKPAAKKALTSVVIPVSSGGRLDPFFPFNEAQKQRAKQPVFDIVAPPLEIPDTDPMIDKLMEVKITGIMYDNVRPSALITVDGSEQLAHKGDVISEYKILNITKDKVVMKYKSNVYEVSAGQMITQGGVNINPVSSSSLSKQFGGAYSQQSKNTIQFN